MKKKKKHYLNAYFNFKEIADARIGNWLVPDQILTNESVIFSSDRPQGVTKEEGKCLPDPRVHQETNTANHCFKKNAMYTDMWCHF